MVFSGFKKAGFLFWFFIKVRKNKKGTKKCFVGTN